MRPHCADPRPRLTPTRATKFGCRNIAPWLNRPGPTFGALIGYLDSWGPLPGLIVLPETFEYYVVINTSASGGLAASSFRDAKLGASPQENGPIMLRGSVTLKGALGKFVIN